MRHVLAILLLCVGAFLAPPSIVRADEEPIPIILTYEMKKQGDEARFVRRNPKAFWIRQIVTRIEDKKEKLPPIREKAVVQVAFVIGRDGHLVSKEIHKSSGVPAVDKTALALLDDAQPFPPMPAGLSDAEQAFTLPVRFH